MENTGKAAGSDCWDEKDEFDFAPNRGLAIKLDRAQILDITVSLASYATFLKTLKVGFSDKAYDSDIERMLATRDEFLGLTEGDVLVIGDK
jgi:hypothetical protein